MDVAIETGCLTSQGVADPKQTENQAPTEAPVNEPTSEIKKKSPKPKKATGQQGRADQIRKVGQTGVFT